MNIIKYLPTNFTQIWFDLTN